MKLLGIDFGRRFVGLARATVPPGLPEPWCVLPVRGREDALRRLADIVRSESIDLIVMGVPLDADGEAGPNAARLERIGRALSRATGVEIRFVDEYGTSADAREAVGGNVRVDALAAAAILRRHLDPSWRAS